MSTILPYQAHLTYLKKQAKRLLRAQRAGDRQVCQQFQEHIPRLAHVTPEALLQATVTLREAQHVVARWYGFAGWKELTTTVAAAAGDVAFRSFHHILALSLWAREIHTLIDSVEEIKDEEAPVTMPWGQVYKIERNTASEVQMHITEHGHSGWNLRHIQAMQERPAVYPNVLPFLPNRDVWIAHDGPYYYMRWQYTVGKEAPDVVESFVQSPAWKQFSQVAQAWVKQIREGRAEARQHVFQMAQKPGFGQSNEVELSEWSARLQHDLADETLQGEHFEEQLRDIIQQSQRAKWTVLEEKGNNVEKYTILEKGRRRRTIQSLNALHLKRLQLWDTI